MAIEKIPREYSAAIYEKIIGSLLRRLESLEAAQTVKKIASMTSDAHPLLRIGELGFVRNDSQNLDLVLRADDGRNYRIGALVASSTSSVGSGGTNDHGALSGLSDDDHPQYVLDAGDTMTGALVIDAASDAIQLKVQGHSTQTNFLLVLEDSAGNDQLTVSNDGAVVINEEGNDADFRVESDGDANALYVDASANTVQVGAATTADSAKFYVAGKISASGDINTNGVLKVDDTQVVGNQQAAIADLTDNTTGTPAAELVDVTILTAADPAKVNDNFASVLADLADIKAAMRTHGLIDT